MTSCDRINVEHVVSLLKTHPNHRVLFIFLRAYAFGYVITAGPRLIAHWTRVILRYAARQKRKRNRPSSKIKSFFNLAYALFYGTVQKVLWGTFHIRGFAMMCGLAMGGGQLLEELIIEEKKKKKKLPPATTTNNVVKTTDNGIKPPLSQHEEVATTFVTATVASSLSLYYMHRMSPSSLNKTIDLTLFALIRAFDVLVRILYYERMSERSREKWITKWLKNHADTVVFVISCTEVMFAWFYTPQQLPKPYVHWITRMSELDHRIREVLRLIRSNDVVYGKDTGYAELLGDYAIEIGLDPKSGDPANGQIPCILVHGNMTESCELHAGLRWVRGFLMALKVYLPVHILPPLLFRPRHFLKQPIPAIIASARSSSFLATFIAVIWYSCCLVRNRIGKVLFPKLNPTQWDKLGPLLGCFLCGFSLLFESKRRRGEMALYIAPRALYSFWVRIVGDSEWWNRLDALRELSEICVFGFAMGVVVTAVKYRKGMVRPMVRGVLGWILDT